MIALAAIEALLKRYGYALLLPAVIVEGPIVTVIASFLASLGVFNTFAVYAIAVAGDVIGDAMYYWIGRAGRYAFISKYGRYIGITEPRVRRTEEHYSKHLLKTLVFAKVTQAPVLAVIVSAGISKVNFWKFIGLVLLITLPKVLIFTLLGYFVGKSYPLIGHYLNGYLAVMSIVVVTGTILYLLIKRFSRSTPV